jgi:peptidoglycan/LPS O-acetylase OafA/YrhL
MPLATLGALIGFLVLLMKWRLAPGRNDTLLNIVLSGSLNLFMLPSFFVGKVYGHEMFPGDNPLWSLFFELVANLAWGWLAVRLTVRQLAAFVAVSAACLATMAVVHGSTQMGVTPATFGGGLARATFGFTLGVLLWRVRDHLRFPAAAWQALACAGILLFTFIGPLVLVHGKSQALAWDLACIFLVFPPLMGLGAARRPAGRLGVVLGELSYPVYVLHWPCLALAAGFAQRLGLNSLVLSAVLVPAIVFAAWLTHKLYDVPVRRWLGRRPGIAVARPA